MILANEGRCYYRKKTWWLIMRGFSGLLRKPWFIIYSNMINIFVMLMPCHGLVAYFTYLHEMPYPLSHSLTSLNFLASFLILFFHRLFIGWRLWAFSLNYFVFTIFKHFFHFISRSLPFWESWWQIMLKLINGKDAKSHTGHNTSPFLSKFQITLSVIFGGSLQRICCLLHKCFEASCNECFVANDPLLYWRTTSKFFRYFSRNLFGF